MRQAQSDRQRKIKEIARWNKEIYETIYRTLLFKWLAKLYTKPTETFLSLTFNFTNTHAHIYTPPKLVEASIEKGDLYLIG